MAPSNPSVLRHTVQDAAILTSLSDWTIRDAIHKGDLPADRNGRRFEILHEDLTAWFESQPKTGAAS